MQTFPSERRAAFTLLEMLVACAILLPVSAALFTGFIALHRQWMASIDFATHQADEMRLSDWVARDLRAASSVSVSGAGASTRLEMDVPNFYASNGAPRFRLGSGGASATVASTLSNTTLLRNGPPR